HRPVRRRGGGGGGWPGRDDAHRARGNRPLDPSGAGARGRGRDLARHARHLPERRGAVGRPGRHGDLTSIRRMRSLRTVAGLGRALAGRAPWRSSPDPVTSESEYFEVGPLGSHRFLAGTDTFPGEGLLLSPHYMVRLERIEVTDVAPEGSTWGPDHASSRPKAAAAGHEFVIVKVDFDWELVRWRPTSGTAPDADHVSLSISIGERAQACEELPGWGYGLVVSAPEGAEVWLRVTDAGRSQSLNLRDGSRGEDAHEGFYTPAEVTLSPTEYTGT